MQPIDIIGLKGGRGSGRKKQSGLLAKKKKEKEISKLSKLEKHSYKIAIDKGATHEQAMKRATGTTTPSSYVKKNTR